MPNKLMTSDAWAKLSLIMNHASPDEARQHADLRQAIAEFRERRRKLTLTISRLVESKRALESRLRTRARRAEPSASASASLSTEPKE